MLSFPGFRITFELVEPTAGKTFVVQIRMNARRAGKANSKMRCTDVSQFLRQISQRPASMFQPDGSYLIGRREQIHPYEVLQAEDGQRFEATVVREVASRSRAISRS